MAVYVDDFEGRYGRMIMCHMMADTTEELLAMADAIGVRRKWIQHAGIPSREHFDIAKTKRDLAIKAGAEFVTAKEMAAYAWHIRTTGERIHPMLAYPKMMDEFRARNGRN